MGCTCAITSMPVGVGGVHDVARVDQAQPDAAVDGRGDAAVNQLQLGVVDGRLVGLDRAFLSADRGDLRVQLLLGDGILRQQRFVAVQIDARVGEQRLVVGHLSFGLVELHLERARIDLQRAGRPSAPTGPPERRRS